MKLAGPQGGRRLDIQITYRFPHIGRKSRGCSPAGRCPIVNIPHYGLYQRLFACCPQRFPIGLSAAVIGFTHSLHLLWDCKVTDAHFPQIMVHIVAEMVEQRLA